MFSMLVFRFRSCFFRRLSSVPVFALVFLYVVVWRRLHLSYLGFTSELFVANAHFVRAGIVSRDLIVRFLRLAITICGSFFYAGQRTAIVRGFSHLFFLAGLNLVSVGRYRPADRARRSLT